MVNYAGKFASRKGMGIELALLVLFVVFACSTLLVSSAMLGKSNLNDRKDAMIQRMELDRFAEEVLATDSFTDNNENYDHSWSDDKKTLTVTEQGSGTPVLTVTVEGGKIASWVYR